MWKNSLKNAESDNIKILYETLLDFFFYSETVLTFWISLVHIIQFHLYHSVIIYSNWLKEQFCNLSSYTIYIYTVSAINILKNT